MTQVFTNKQGKIRLYDGTATPYYLELAFDAGDFDGPLGIPMVEEKLILDRGNVVSGVHYIEGSDDKIMEPLALSFSGMLRDTASTTYLKAWLDALNDGATTTVNSHTLTTTKGTTQRVSGVANPTFADSLKIACNVEVLWNTSGTDFGLKYAECLFVKSEQKIKESADGVVVSFSGQCYGTITDSSAFTSGTNVTA